MFEGLQNLKALSLYNNGLVELSSDLFKDLRNLHSLFLWCTELTVFPSELFCRLQNLVQLYVDRNQLVMLNTNQFKHLQNLTVLYLSENKLRNLSGELFYGLVNLKILELASKRLKELDNRVFRDLNNLNKLYLQDNMLSRLGKYTFKGLHNLKHLQLSSNYLSELDSVIFKFKNKITHLWLNSNRLTKLPSFKELTQLTFLNLSHNALTFADATSFTVLPSNVNLVVSQQEICQCYVSTDISCIASNNRSPYLQCERLLSDKSLAILMWLIGINALGGNIFVLIWWHKTSQRGQSQDKLLSNLAISDSLMGVYMLVIASADIYFGDNFPIQAEKWRSGFTCKIAGAVAIISSEGSVFFVTLISIDRFICIRFPFSDHKLNRKSVNVIVIITWVTSLAFGITPSSLAGKDFKFYENSHICIGLPLVLTERFLTKKSVVELQSYKGCGIPVDEIIRTFETKSLGITHGLYFSIVLLLGLNLLCYIIILICYVEIVRAVYKSSRRTNLSKEMRDEVRMTAKVVAIVATDFCCWFPIIIMGILVQTRAVILPPSVYA